MNFYVFKPLYQRNYIILVPANITKVFIRPIISKGEANRLFDLIPTIVTKTYYNCKLSRLSEHYETFLKTYDIYAKSKLQIICSENLVL